MQTQGVHHVAINVDDVDAAIAFYTKSLGMTVRTDRPDFGFPGAWLDTGNQQVHLVHAPTPPAQGQHFALLVADLDTAIADLRDSGVQVSDAVPVGSARQAFVTDPSGNTIELHQRAG
jgi:catechol 2,3-dioxygenase-like lactoylglutathione lyase family enzyme